MSYFWVSLGFLLSVLLVCKIDLLAMNSNRKSVVKKVRLVKQQIKNKQIIQWVWKVWVYRLKEAEKKEVCRDPSFT